MTDEISIYNDKYQVILKDVGSLQEIRRHGEPWITESEIHSLKAGNVILALAHEVLALRQRAARAEDDASRLRYPDTTGN